MEGKTITIIQKGKKEEPPITGPCTLTINHIPMIDGIHHGGGFIGFDLVGEAYHLGQGENIKFDITYGDELRLYDIFAGDSDACMNPTVIYADNPSREYTGESYICLGEPIVVNLSINCEF